MKTSQTLGIALEYIYVQFSQIWIDPYSPVLGQNRLFSEQVRIVSHFSPTNILWLSGPRLVNHRSIYSEVEKRLIK